MKYTKQRVREIWDIVEISNKNEIGDAKRAEKE